jgi:hypothetical protein
VGFESATSAPIVRTCGAPSPRPVRGCRWRAANSGIILDASVQNCPPHKSSLHESCLAPTTRTRPLGRSSITSSGFEKNSSSFNDAWRKWNRLTLTERLREFQSSPLPTPAPNLTTLARTAPCVAIDGHPHGNFGLAPDISCSEGQRKRCCSRLRLCEDAAEI